MTTHNTAQIQHRSALENADRAQSDMFDRTLITLSSGALAVSLTFLRDVAVEVAPGTRAWILSAWLLLAGSMFSVLASFKVSQRAVRKEIRDSDEGVSVTIEGGRPAVVTKALNAISLGAFAAGLMLLLLFAYRNLGGG